MKLEEVLAQLMPNGTLPEGKDFATYFDAYNGSLVIRKSFLGGHEVMPLEEWERILVLKAAIFDCWQEVVDGVPEDVKVFKWTLKDMEKAERGWKALFRVHEKKLLRSGAEFPVFVLGGDRFDVDMVWCPGIWLSNVFGKKSYGDVDVAEALEDENPSFFQKCDDVIFHLEHMVLYRASILWWEKPTKTTTHTDVEDAARYIFSAGTFSSNESVHLEAPIDDYKKLVWCAYCDRNRLVGAAHDAAEISKNCEEEKNRKALDLQRFAKDLTCMSQLRENERAKTLQNLRGAVMRSLKEWPKCKRCGGDFELRRVDTKANTIELGHPCLKKKDEDPNATEFLDLRNVPYQFSAEERRRIKEYLK
jgi:hypothetical protein